MDLINNQGDSNLSHINSDNSIKLPMELAESMESEKLDSSNESLFVNHGNDSSIKKKKIDLRSVLLKVIESEEQEKESQQSHKDSILQE